ncbi:hypothetical protein KM043_008246 [Ampulex compressa]|nr:hypothetical protein KM043_008246 [Ampulex compressa]
MLTDMTPAAAGQLYPQLQSITKSPAHGHVIGILIPAGSGGIVDLGDQVLLWDLSPSSGGPRSGGSDKIEDLVEREQITGRFERCRR